MKSITRTSTIAAYDESIGFRERIFIMTASIEQIASSTVPPADEAIGGTAFAVVAIVMFAGALQFFVARLLRQHGKPAQQAENLATAAAATLVAVLVPIAAYLTRS